MPSPTTKSNRAPAPVIETIAPAGAHAQRSNQELWNVKTVSLKTGLSRASIYRYSALNLFPARRRIGPGRVAWLAREVLAWMETRP
jgi:predicted DNA-binding transcriptional regulator AlpA